MGPSVVSVARQRKGCGCVDAARARCQTARVAGGSQKCSRCGQDAPTVVRGLETFCVACGAPRLPLAAMPVNLAGRPSKVGGTIARVLGWAALVGGLSAAAIVGALLQVIFPAGVAGW